MAARRAISKIDLSPLFNPKLATRDWEHHFANAIIKDGCFGARIPEHVIPAKLISEMYRISHAFHTKPDSPSKRSLHVSRSKYSRGWVPLLEEPAYEPGTVSFVESFDSAREIPLNHPAVLRGRPGDELLWMNEWHWMIHGLMYESKSYAWYPSSFKELLRWVRMFGLLSLKSLTSRRSSLITTKPPQPLRMLCLVSSSESSSSRQGFCRQRAPNWLAPNFACCGSILISLLSSLFDSWFSFLFSSYVSTSIMEKKLSWNCFEWIHRGEESRD